MRTSIARLSALGLSCIFSLACSQPGTTASDGGAPPALTPSATEPIKRVLLLSIDGFHGSDLERYIKSAPTSMLAQLAAVGMRYSNISAPFPSDSFPSVLAWATGGTPRSTGVFYDISYDRMLSPPATTCATMGTTVDYSEVADKDPTIASGGGSLDPLKLPRDPSNACSPVYPHSYLRVNTIFEVAKAAGFRTAWLDKHLSYEVLHGPSGTGVDDLFNPEIAAVDTKTFQRVADYDRGKVDAVINQINGKDHAGNAATVPGLFGMNFQAVSIEQKAAGYADAAGTPTLAVQSAIDAVDQQLARIVTELNNTGLWSSTVLIVTASHGQSPIDPALVKRIPTTVVPSIVESVATGTLAHATQDAVALLWLTDPSKTAAVAQQLANNKVAVGLDNVLSGPDIVTLFGDPASDSRIPHVIGVVKTGTIYTDSKKKFAEHGGFSDDDRKVMAIVVGGTPGAAANAEAVETRQIAATILSALNLDPQKLNAVVKEKTAALPGLTFRH